MMCKISFYPSAGDSFASYYNVEQLSFYGKQKTLAAAHKIRVSTGSGDFEGFPKKRIYSIRIAAGGGVDGANKVTKVIFPRSLVYDVLKSLEMLPKRLVGDIRKSSFRDFICAIDPGGERFQRGFRIPDTSRALI